jgi:ammonia channel protein AmtB
VFFSVNKITPLRVSEEKEELGLDISQHGEFYNQALLLVLDEIIL